MKRLLLVLICILAVFSVFVLMWGRSNPEMVASVSTAAFILPRQESAPPASLEGSWTQRNSGDAESYMTARIQGGIIQVYWVMEGGDSTALYWQGSFTPPEALNGPYTWVSENDHTQTDASLMASADDTKEFTCQDGELCFSATLLGTTKTIRMTKDAP